MTPSIVRKVLLARRLWDLSRRHLDSSSELALVVGINLLQDAVEAFLLAVAEHLNAGIVEKTNFYQYFDLINAKLGPSKIPFRARLIALNKLRVNAKHSGLVPARSDVSGLPMLVRELFEVLAEQVFATRFAAISLIDLIKDDETRTLLEEAEAAFAINDYETCLVACRKVFFLQFESSYDVAGFAEDDEGSWLANIGCRAPYYARDAEYIRKNVLDPTDYIVLDHNDIEIELMKDGIDSVTFWNVWRFTPEVYRRRREDSWFVKRDFAKLDSDGIAERAEYVLDAIMGIALASQQSREEIKWIRPMTTYHVTLAKEQVPIYKKASVDSEVSYQTPPGLTQLSVDYEILGLDGVTEFWHVIHFGDQLHIFGFLPKSQTQ